VFFLQPKNYFGNNFGKLSFSVNSTKELLKKNLEKNLESLENHKIENSPEKKKKKNPNWYLLALSQFLLNFF
jgi:hypothetical protein